MTLRSLVDEAAMSARRNSFRCVNEAVFRETIGEHDTMACRYAWIGALVFDLYARVLGYRGPTLEQWLRRPPRPLPRRADETIGGAR